MANKKVAVFAVISAWLALALAVLLGLILEEFPVPLVLATGIIAISVTGYWGFTVRNSSQ